MLTIEQILEYLNVAVTEDYLRGDKHALRRIQMTAGMLMAAAETYGDKATAYEFRKVAAHAANRQEEMSGD